jgi:hypothetical protein
MLNVGFARRSGDQTDNRAFVHVKIDASNGVQAAKTFRQPATLS